MHLQCENLEKGGLFLPILLTATSIRGGEILQYFTSRKMANNCLPGCVSSNLKCSVDSPESIAHKLPIQCMFWSTPTLSFGLNGNRSQVLWLTYFPELFLTVYNMECKLASSLVRRTHCLLIFFHKVIASDRTRKFHDHYAARCNYCFGEWEICGSLEKELAC